MKAPLLILAHALIMALSLPALAGQAEQGRNDAWVASWEAAIKEAKDERTAALLRKELGDYYASREDYARAAGEYVQVISLSPSPFSAAERLQMAISLSWADRLDEAARVLRQLLDEDPKDSDARTQLAKVLSWSNNLGEAGAEADRVLEDQPGNQEALLVKANVLRWQGKARESMPWYRKALDQGEYFDARLGLAYACLELGDKASVRENIGMLKPAYPRQEKELQKLEDALCAARTDRPGVQYDRYTDSDNNRVNRSFLYYGFTVAGWNSEVRYGYIDAADPVRRTNAQALSIRTSRREHDLTTGAGLGVTRTGRGGGNLLTGHATFDLDLGRGTAGVAAAREALTDTAQLIENEITRSMATLALSQRPSQELSFFETYAYAGFSDGNAATDLGAAAKYTVMGRNPKVDAGYRFRYRDFRRQSGSGYFDPQDFISHQLFLSFYTEFNGFYVYAEPYAGLQSFTRYGEKSSGMVSGVSASAGWSAKRCTSFELYGEIGNDASATAAGFAYYIVGFKLSLFI